MPPPEVFPHRHRSSPAIGVISRPPTRRSPRIGLSRCALPVSALLLPLLPHAWAARLVPAVEGPDGPLDVVAAREDPDEQPQEDEPYDRRRDPCGGVPGLPRC